MLPLMVHSTRRDVCMSTRGGNSVDKRASVDIEHLAGNVAR
jgi:hypothetical protein